MSHSPERLQLPIEGMTCASCANRIEKRLNELDGVEASVNYATEAASVEYDPAHVSSPTQLIEAVEGAGYHATLPSAEPAAARSARPTRWSCCGAGCCSPRCSRCRSS